MAVADGSMLVGGGGLVHGSLDAEMVSAVIPGWKCVTIVEGRM